MRFLTKVIEALKGNERFKKVRKEAFMIASALVVFVTTYALILPAITMDSGTASHSPGVDVGEVVTRYDEDGNIIEAEANEDGDPQDGTAILVGDADAQKDDLFEDDGKLTVSHVGQTLSSALKEADEELISEDTDGELIVEEKDEKKDAAAGEAEASVISYGIAADLGADLVDDYDETNETAVSEGNDTEDADGQDDDQQDDEDVSGSDAPLIEDDDKETEAVSEDKALTVIPDGQTEEQTENASEDPTEGSSEKTEAETENQADVGKGELESITEGLEEAEDKLEYVTDGLEDTEEREEIEESKETESVTEVSEEVESITEGIADTEEETESISEGFMDIEEETESVSEGSEDFDIPAETGIVLDNEEIVYIDGQLEPYQGDGYTVYLTCSEDAQIPEGAKIEVREIDPIEDKDEYDMYLSATKDAMGLGEEDELPPEQARFFDITILAKDESGEYVEIEPAKGAFVQVQIEYDEAISVPDTDQVKALHFVDNGEEPEKLQIHEIVTNEADDTAGTSVTSVTFGAESFSVFGVVYSVSYQVVDGGEAPLQGGTNATLRGLAVDLGIVKSAEKLDSWVRTITDVKTSDENIVKVTETVGEETGAKDWLIEAQTPEESQEDQEDTEASRSAIVTVETKTKKIEIAVSIIGHAQVNVLSDTGVDAVISAVSGDYLPEEAVGQADEITGTDEAAQAVASVESAETVEQAAESTEDVETAGQMASVLAMSALEKVSAQAVDPALATESDRQTTSAANAIENVPAAQANTVADAMTTAQASSMEDAETNDGSETAVTTQYAVFDIDLLNVAPEDYEDGFRVELTLPARLVGRDFKLYHLHEGELTQVESLDVDSVETENGIQIVSGFSFETPNFSTFVLRYTVDFEYINEHGMRFAWSWPGEGSYIIADIMAEIGVEGEISEVSLERTVDEGGSEKALYLSEDQTELVSEEAFNDTFELTVVVDNETYVLTVTDDAAKLVGLRELLQYVNIEIDGEVVTGNNWNVKEGSNYNITLNFQEIPSKLQLDVTGEISYQLPDGLTIPNELNDGLNITHNGIPLKGNTFKVTTDGKIIFNLTEETKRYVEDSGDGKFQFEIIGKFTSDVSKVEFSDSVKKEIDVTPQHNAKIAKTSWYDADKGVIHYYVDVTAEGEVNNIVVKDTVDGSVAGNIRNVTVKDSNGNSKTTKSTNANGKTLAVTFDSLKNETVRIEYEVPVDYSGLTGTKSEVVKNGVKVTSDEDPSGPDNEAGTSNTITLSSFNKYGNLQTGDGDTITKDGKTYRRVKWTITANGEKITTLNYIEDAIAPESRAIMQYDTDTQMEVKIAKKNGDWEIKNVNMSDILLGDKYSWHYDLPTGDAYEKAAYTISYYTLVDVTNLVTNVSVKNDANNDKGGTSGGAVNVGPREEDKLYVEKNVDTVTTDDIVWTITMNVPAAGFATLELKDVFPVVGDWGLQDTLDDSYEVQVTGLVNGEHMERVELTDSQVIYRFYKSEGTSDEGLIATSANRAVTVTLRTKNDQSWVELSADKTWLRGHTNTATVTANGTPVTDTAVGYPSIKRTVKTTAGFYTKKVGGVEYPAYRFRVRLEGVDADTITLNELFDTGLFTMDTGDNAPKIHGGSSQYSLEGEYSYDSVVTTPTTTGATFVITLPKNPNSDRLYAFYDIEYALVVKSDEGLSELGRQAIEAGGSKTFKNTIKWGNVTGESEFTYDYPGLKKTGMLDEESGVVHYTLVLNPGKQRLLNGYGNGLLEMKDTFVNLSVKFNTIQFATEPAGREDDITFNYSGNTGTYYIPDETKVTITYDASVVGDENISFSNEATMAGYVSRHSGTYSNSASGSGQINTYELWLFKYDTDQMNHGLNGAEFTLVDENGDPYRYPAEHTKAGKPITFTTETWIFTSDGSIPKEGYTGETIEKDGYARIFLSESEDGISLQPGRTFYLKETKAPEGYKPADFLYQFTISTHPNYLKYEFYSEDVLKASNKKAEGVLEISKEIAGADGLNDAQRKAITFEITSDVDGFETVHISYDDFVDGKYTLRGLKPGNYTVAETHSAIPGYAYNSTSYSVNGVNTEYVQSGDIAKATFTITEDSEKQTFEVKNAYSNDKANLKIQKVDAEHNTYKLYGAVFELQKKNSNGTYEKYNGPGDIYADGIKIDYQSMEDGVTIVGLDNGDYQLVETIAPKGYKGLTNPIQFTITNQIATDSVKYDDAAVGSSEVSTENLISYESNSKTLTIGNKRYHGYTITKTEYGDSTVKLAGAKFTVYEVTGSIDTTWQNGKLAGTAGLQEVKTYTTDDSGKFEIKFEDEGYEEGKYYIVYETEAPSGYELPTKVTDRTAYLFHFGGDNMSAAGAVDLLVKDGFGNVEDKPISTTMIVEKKWYDSIGQQVTQYSGADKVEFHVIRQVLDNNGDPIMLKQVRLGNGGTKTVEEIGTSEYYPNENTVYTINRKANDNTWPILTLDTLPKHYVDENGITHDYTYFVEEIVPDGYVVEYSYGTSDDGSRAVVMTNRPEYTSLTVRKVWAGEMPDNFKNMDPYVQVSIQRKSKNGGSWETNFDPKFGQKQVVYLYYDTTKGEGRQSEVTWNYLPKGYVYRVVESYSNSALPPYYVTTYADGEGNELKDFLVDGVEDGTVIVTNTYTTVTLNVTKKWTTNPEGDWRIQLTLYREPGDGESQNSWITVPVDGRNEFEIDSNNPTKRITDLLPGYKYRFEEKKVLINGTEVTASDYVASYSSDNIYMPDAEGNVTAVITNTLTKKDAGIEVIKKWIDQNEKELTDTSDLSPVKFNVQQAKVEDASKKITVNVRWTYVVKEGSWDGTQNVDKDTDVEGTFTYTIRAIAGSQPKLKVWIPGTSNSSDTLSYDSGITGVQYDANTFSLSLPVVDADRTYTVSIAGKYGQYNDNPNCSWENESECKFSAELTDNAVFTTLTENGTPVQLEVNASNWTASRDGLPKEGNENGTHYYYYYKLEEVADNDEYEVEYINNDGIQSGIIYAVNKAKPQYGNLKLSKELIGVPEGNDNRFFWVTIKNSAGDYLQRDKSFGTTAQEWLVRPSHPLELTHLPVDTYTVKELTGTGYTDNIPSYAWTTDGSISELQAKVQKNETTSVTLVNKYENDETSIKAKKVWTNMPANARVKVELSATIPDAENTGEVVDVTAQVLPEGVSAVQTLVGDAEYEWTSLVRHYEGHEVTYNVDEVEVSIDGEVAWATDDETVNNPYLQDKVIAGNETTFTNNYKSFRIVKRWMAGGSVYKPLHDNGTVYYKILKTDGTDRIFVNEYGQEDNNAIFELTATTYEWVKGSDLGGDTDIITPLAGKGIETKAEDGATWYRIPYMHAFEKLPVLPAGWDYTAVELSTSSDHFELNGAGDGYDDDDQYWTCNEFNGTTFALKNNLETVTAKKIWDDSDNKGLYHPEVTFKLYKTEINIPVGTTEDLVSAEKLKHVGTDGDGKPIYKPLTLSDIQNAASGKYTLVSDKTIPTGSSSGTEVKWEDMPQWNLQNGKRIVYIVVEDDSENKIAPYIYDGGTVNTNLWGITNKLPTKDIYVEKIWKDENGNVITNEDKKNAFGQVKFDLMRVAYSKASCEDEYVSGDKAGTKVGEYTLPVEGTKTETINDKEVTTKTYDWTIRIPSLPTAAYTSGGVVYYNYYVVETSPSDFGTHYRQENEPDGVYHDSGIEAKASVARNNSDGLKIYNQIKPTTIEASKVWKYGDTTLASWPEDIYSITFTLQASIDGGSTWANATGLTNGQTASKTIVYSDTTKKVEWTNLSTRTWVESTKQWTITTYKVVETAVTFTEGSNKTSLTSAEQVAAAYGATWNSTDRTITNSVNTERHAQKVWIGTEANSVTFTLSAKDSANNIVNLGDYGVIAERTLDKPQNGAWPTANWTDLPEYTTDGKRITYEVSETDIEGYKKNGPVWNETTKTWTITNTELTEFEFSKQWKSVDRTIKWPEGLTINVELRRAASVGEPEKTGFVSIKESDKEVTVKFGEEEYTIKRVSTDGNIYSYKVSGLSKFKGNNSTDPWTYSIIEQQVSGYNMPKYFTINDAETDEVEKHTDGNVSVAAGPTGGVRIENDQITIALPATGGIGTTIFYVAGAVLVVAALILLIAKRGAGKEEDQETKQ